MKFAKAGSGKITLREDYSKEIIFGTDELPPGGHLLQIVTIPPQTKQRIHFHDQQTEVFLVLSGTCDIVINETTYTANPGDAFICSPGDTHNLHNRTDSDFKLAVFKINLPENDDTHWNS